MKYLFVHHRCPGQFGRWSRALAQSSENEVVFLTEYEEFSIPSVRVVTYTMPESNPAYKETVAPHMLASSVRAQAAADRAEQLKAEGFYPDIIFGHSNWGELLFLKLVYPDIPLLGYFEFYFLLKASNLDFDAEFPVTLEMKRRAILRNSVNWLQADLCDWGLAPTEWQRSLYPKSLQQRMSVIHEGVDTTALKPEPAQTITFGKNAPLTPTDELITFVNRNLEPYRGIHTFLRALPRILSDHPRAIVAIVGSEGKGYGPMHPSGRSWKSIFLEETPVDPSRVFFLGRLPYEGYIALLQVSAVHVYLTCPFVLSWSLMEAMSCGCAVVASDTAPVREVVKHNQNGILVDFFSPEELAAAVSRVLRHPTREQALRTQARATIVSRYDFRSICLPALNALVSRIVREHQSAL